MYTLTRWNPFKEIEEAQRRLSSVFDLGTLRGNGPRNGDENLTVAEWSPLVDIVEDDKEYVIKAELPEVKKSDVKVSVENGTLHITGERHTEKEDKTRRFHRIERAYGRFERSFTLPDDADGTRVSAEFKDGILCVHLAKSEAAKPRQIEVKVS